MWRGVFLITAAALRPASHSGLAGTRGRCATGTSSGRSYSSQRDHQTDSPRNLLSRLSAVKAGSLFDYRSCAAACSSLRTRRYSRKMCHRHIFWSLVQFSKRSSNRLPAESVAKGSSLLWWGVFLITAAALRPARHCRLAFLF